MNVVLIRPKQFGAFSTMRFADALDGGFAGTSVSLRHEYPGCFEFAARIRAQRLERYVQRSILHPRSLRRGKGDIFHVLDHSYAGVVRALPPERAIVTCHDLALLAVDRAELPARERHAVGRFRRQVARMLEAAAVACDSEATKQDVLRIINVPSERVRVIPAGVTSTFQPISAEERAVARSRLAAGTAYLILHVSTGGFYKNVSATLRTVAELRAAGTDASLIRVGLPLTPLMQRLAASLRIEPYIKELGRPTDAELSSIYGAADVLLFPSLHEGFGLPVLEAMACGTPIVASNISALVELLGGAGLTAPPHDIQALAAAIFRMVSNPDVAEPLKQAGLERARSFTWQRVIDDYRRLYEDVWGAAVA